MKILYVATKYDYGKRERGLSFEHANFFDSLYNMGNDIIYFDYMDILKKMGRSRMNNLLLEVVRAEKPELMFVFLSEYELEPKTISKISKSEKIITINWFADDHWRFDNYSRYWAPNFNWVVTTDSEALPKYHAAAYHNVILSQWACNHFLYKNLELDHQYDVSFIGQTYGNRKAIIQTIEAAGIHVETRGQGWAAGRVYQDEMINIINRSRINLNLSNASVKYVGEWLKPIDKFALYTPGLKRIWHKMRSFIPARLAKSRPIFQIKGRNFEVPGCGGFLLTDYIQGLEEFYQAEREVVCYNSVTELIKKIQFYLVHDSLRQQIALAGYQSTLEKHTYVHRFNQIFRQIGLKNDYSLDKHPGSCVEISQDK
ncbi:MAG: glycosyltransferase [Anaerolineales bacterium]|nr:glycosyltransferase [Anaerolineales bacterium]